MRKEMRRSINLSEMEMDVEYRGGTELTSERGFSLIDDKNIG